MHELRSRLGSSVAEARAMLDAAPVTVVESAPAGEACQLAQAFERAGADVVAEPVGDRPAPKIPPAEWVEAPWSLLPDEDALLCLADAELTNKEAQKWLRVAAWQSGNDAFREAAIWVPLGVRDQARKNVEQLIMLLGANPDEQLLRAECLRELCKFEQAVELLQKLGGNPGANVISGWANAHNDRVEVLAATA
jgi:hypothetical protein